jgi:hypothetical protein
MGLMKTITSATWTRLRQTSRRLKALPFEKAYRRATRRFMKLPFRVRFALLLIVIIGIVTVIKGVTYFLPHARPEVFGTTDTAGSVQTGSNLTAPNYNTLLPEGKSIEQLGGWTRVSPSDRNPVFAYRDYIGETPINVSQQPLPDEFKKDVKASIDELAHSYHADDSIKAGGTAVYIGTSAKGPQSVILSKNGLLILIKSSVVISDKRWAGYIDSLH